MCGIGGNTITATVSNASVYAWTVGSPDNSWSVTGGQNTLCATYQAGSGGTSGTFVITATNPLYGFSATCSLTVNSRCEQYCTYNQAFWGNGSALACNGSTSTSLMTTALSSPLVNGGSSRKVTIGTTESSCLRSKLPAGTTYSSLPSCNVSCAQATGSTFLSNGKFKNGLLGNTIALGLSLRLQPALGTVRITGRYLTTYTATTCNGGTAVPGTKIVYSMPSSVVSGLGSANTVNDLLALANRVLNGTCSSPSATDVNTALVAILNGFSNCKVLAGFSNSSAGSRETETAPLPDAAPEAARPLLIYPNPSNGSATVAFFAGEGVRTSLEVFDISGSRIALLWEAETEAQLPYLVEIPGESWPAGIYFIRLTSGDEVSIGKMVITGLR